MSEFQRTVFPGLSFFRLNEIPVVCVAPLALQLVQDDFVGRFFDRIHELNSIPAVKKGVLDEMIRLRDTQALLTQNAVSAIRVGSGRLLRIFSQLLVTRVRKPPFQGATRYMPTEQFAKQVLITCADCRPSTWTN